MFSFLRRKCQKQTRLSSLPNHKLSKNVYLVKILSVISNKPYRKPFKDEAQTVLFTHPVRSAQKTIFISVIKTNQLMLYRAKVAVWAEINAKHIIAVWAECTVVECQTWRCITWRLKGYYSYVQADKHRQYLPLLRNILRNNSRYCLCLLWLLSEVSLHTFITVRQNQTGRFTVEKANTWQAGIITDFVYTNICCHLIIKEYNTNNSFCEADF